MKTISVDVFTFDELKPEVQEKVLNDLRHVNTEHDWYEDVEITWREKLQDMGFKDSEISFSGFSSQGDGASFVCKWIDLRLWIGQTPERLKKYEALIPLIEEEDVTASITRINYHYVHARSISADVGYGGRTEGDEHESLVVELEKDLDTDAESISNKIYRELEADYDALTSDESVRETIKLNEWTFEINGKMRNE